MIPWFPCPTRVVVFPCPISRYGRAERERRRARASAKEWKAALSIDSVKQYRPSPFLEFSGHLTLRTRLDSASFGIYTAMTK